MTTSTTKPTLAGGGVARRWTLAILVLAFLFVLMPFLFWQSTWFGRPLTDEKLGEYFADANHPRKAQHALSQIADRIVGGDAGVKRWYPQVISLTHHAVPEIRVTAAWVMGQDNRANEFHESLLPLLNDAHPMVRRNAALSLVRHGDPSGRPELVAMLRPYVVRAPYPGIIDQRLKIGDAVNSGTLLGRLRRGEEETELRSEVPGSVLRWVAAEGMPIEDNQDLVLIAPSAEMVWEALRALLLVGTREDLPEVEQYARPIEGMPPNIRQQAVNTARAIRSRNAE